MRFRTESGGRLPSKGLPVRGLFTRGRDAGNEVNRKGVVAGEFVSWLSVSVAVVSNVTCVLVDAFKAVLGGKPDLGRVGVRVALNCCDDRGRWLDGADFLARGTRYCCRRLLVDPGVEHCPDLFAVDDKGKMLCFCVGVLVVLERLGSFRTVPGCTISAGSAMACCRRCFFPESSAPKVDSCTTLLSYSSHDEYSPGFSLLLLLFSLRQFSSKAASKDWCNAVTQPLVSSSCTFPSSSSELLPLCLPSSKLWVRQMPARAHPGLLCDVGFK
mmetsp:Transcript_9178/g.13075  ORF Transcript_9178/g.13075 Transcript_9178/m.13075 type:complete len:271 (-) Transcript_9178:278-1090(-)